MIDLNFFSPRYAVYPVARRNLSKAVYHITLGKELPRLVASGLDRVIEV